MYQSEDKNNNGESINCVDDETGMVTFQKRICTQNNYMYPEQFMASPIYHCLD